MPLDEAHDPVARHRVRHECLQVVGDGQLLEIAGERQRGLLPAEDEDQARSSAAA